ncbi:hypothetical protein N0V93_006808 [Gnomoniopsis smithogilvyi]|uniref:Uncharacterized protein n=1 Tax=Gnomoniopsis smithogilvyi TaxID=1191159 RepID=A0A9W8YQE7_9PEZI|nr:hypothetical protein N0V93_006808 [Gnomoniopsis smithogilvyi]
MQSTTFITSIVLFLGLAMAAPGPKSDLMARDGQELVETRAELDTRACVINGEDCHGERTCIAGGISCEYADGSRCAKLAATDGSFTAWCPNGHWDKGVYHDIYTGAGCISIFTALGRHSC